MIDKSNVTLAFYKGKGGISDHLIRWWTKSPYSHVEIIIDDIWYSSSPRDLKVRGKVIAPKEGHWEYIKIPVSRQQKRIMLDFFNAQLGKPYDFLGIAFSQVLPFNIQNPGKWFCSEICSKALIESRLLNTRKSAQWFSPGKLYKNWR